MGVDGGVFGVSIGGEGVSPWAVLELMSRVVRNLTPVDDVQSRFLR